MTSLDSRPGAASLGVFSIDALAGAATTVAFEAAFFGYGSFLAALTKVPSVGAEVGTPEGIRVEAPVATIARPGDGAGTKEGITVRRKDEM